MRFDAVTDRWLDWLDAADTGLGCGYPKVTR